MEIALLQKAGLRIKGKQAAIAVDAQDKSVYDAILALKKLPEELRTENESILIFGVGEYEVGGIKLTGVRSETKMIYSLGVDGVDVLIGTLNSLEKMHQKLKEHNIVIVDCDEVGSATFITTLAQNVVIFYGEKAAEVSASFGKETVKQMNKYSSTKDKLPAEVETVLLA